MPWSPQEILETLGMIEMEHLDIRTLTLGVNLSECASREGTEVASRVYQRIRTAAERLVPVAAELEDEFAIPIANRRVSVTPVALLHAGGEGNTFVEIARRIDDAASELGIDFVGGFSALVHKGATAADQALIESIPEALAVTEHVCASVNAATTHAGINMDSVRDMGRIIKATAGRTAARGGIGCAKLVVFANAVEDNPFMAGSFHGVGEPDVVLNVGISGPGVVARAVKKAPGADFGELTEIIKRTAFKITRAGELIGREAARRLGVPFGIVDLSLAPAPLAGDSVGEVLQCLGLERVGAPGSIAALALLTDAVNKGGCMASSYVGGLSGALIPISEDTGMVAAVEGGALSLDKLQAMTSVCSLGLDMVAVPGDTPEETIAAILADQISIGVIGRKTTGVRIIPVPGKRVGERVEFGGLFGAAMVMSVNPFSSAGFISRRGRIPAPVQSLEN